MRHIHIMWTRMGLKATMQAGIDSGDFLTVGKGFYDKKVLVGNYRNIKNSPIKTLIQ